MPAEKTAENFRLSATARECLRQLAERDGLTKTATVERLIRRAAREEGLEVPEKIPEKSRNPS